MQAIKACRGSGDYIYPFLTSALRGGKWLTLSSGRFTPGNEVRQSFHWRLGGLQSRCERFEEDKNIFSLPGFESFSVQPVAYKIFRLKLLNMTSS
jgi:hypothetical protein